MAALVAAALPLAIGRHSGSRRAAVPLPDGAAVADAYHIVYRVTTGPVVSTEELWVHRPFEAEDVVSAGRGSGGEPISTIVDRLGRQLVHSGGTPGVFEPPPAPTPFDVRLDAVAGPALAAKALVTEGDMVVAGRRCSVYRSAQPLGTTALVGRPTAADHVDTCVDAQGLVLQERRVAGGKTVQERVATTVAVGGDAAGHAYRTAGTHLPIKQGGGAVVTISDTSRPPGKLFWEAAQPPKGFSHLGRFAVVESQPPMSSAQSDAAIVTAVDDVFLRGADAVVVEQGQTVGGTPLPAPSGGRDVELGPLGTGRLVLSGTASSVTAQPDGSSFVRVSGTLPPAQLEDVARSLAPQPAGTITTVPDLTSDGP